MKHILIILLVLLPLFAYAWRPDTLRLSVVSEAGGVHYGGYKPMREFETSAPVLAAFGFIAKAGKEDFRQPREHFTPSYTNHADDYLRHAPVAVATALNLLGYQGRSTTGRYFISAAMSYAVMAGFVEGLKHSVSEMRPDGSTDDAFPSGHTATAFVAATILHKEYGQTRSPWFSVAGYGVASATGVMRTLHNRHWVSDVLVGAGIGIISTDIGYALGDMIMKGKGLGRQRLSGGGDMISRPAFLRLSLGMQTNQSFSLPAGAGLTATAEVPRVKVSLGTTVAAEGAYFFGPYVGAGVRARVTAVPVTAEGLYCYTQTPAPAPQRVGGSTSDVWSIIDVAAGLYGAWPVSPRHNIGAKLLYGRRFYNAIELKAVHDTYVSGTSTAPAEPMTIYGDKLNISSTAAADLAAGLHYTYTTSAGVALSAFIDYDYSRPKLDVEHAAADNGRQALPCRFSYKQKLHSFTFGASMAVHF